MLDWLRNHPLWRSFSELDTLFSLFTYLKVGVGVMVGLMVGFWGWLNRQPGSIQFVLFLSACLITIWLVNGVVWLRQQYASNMAQREPSKIVTTSQGTIRAGLYVGDMRFTFTGLEKDRHSELTMRVFNGSGVVVEFSNLLGQIKFNAPNNTDPDRMGTLPTPTLRSDTARTIAPFKEWLLILSTQVPFKEADKLLAMLASQFISISAN